jgi:hypothetical protein
MSQPIVLNHTLTDTNLPALLSAGEAAIGVGPTYTRMWFGDGATNRLLLSDNPVDNSIFGGPFLPLSGGELTDRLTITSPTDSVLAITGTGGWPCVVFNTTTPGSAAGYIEAQRNGFSRWSLQLGDTIQDDFRIGHFADDGSHLGDAIIITRATGAINLQVDPTQPMHATTKQYVDGLVAALDARLTALGG